MHVTILEGQVKIGESEDKMLATVKEVSGMHENFLKMKELFIETIHEA